MIKYPIAKSTKVTKASNLANKGMALEDMVNRSNRYYEQNNIAFILKRPTPIKVIKTEKRYKIIDAIFEKASTTDYYGIYMGRYIDFETKETALKTKFPLSNILDHQFDHIKKVLEHKGIAFALIYFKAHEEVYLIDGAYLTNQKDAGVHDIAYEDFKKNGVLIKASYVVPIDYVKVIKAIYFEKEK